MKNWEYPTILFTKIFVSLHCVCSTELGIFSLSYSYQKSENGVSGYDHLYFEPCEYLIFQDSRAFDSFTMEMRSSTLQSLLDN